jgi:hypothetical protein
VTAGYFVEFPYVPGVTPEAVIDDATIVVERVPEAREERGSGAVRPEARPEISPRIFAAEIVEREASRTAMVIGSDPGRSAVKGRSVMFVPRIAGAPVQANPDPVL